MNSHRLFQSLILLAVLSGLVFAPPAGPAAAQMGAASVCVFDKPDFERFPDVTFSARVMDNTQNAVATLQLSDFSLTENGQPVNLRGSQLNTSGVGLNIYFVVDQGNRTEQRLVREALLRFAQKYMVNELDRVAIVTSVADSRRENPKLYLAPTTSLAKFTEAATSFPTDGAYRSPASGLDAVREAISLIRSDRFGCTRPNLIVALMGEDIEHRQSNDPIIKDALQVGAVIHIAHSPRGSANEGDKQYQELAAATYGTFNKVKDEGTNAFTNLDQGLFNILANQRSAYTLSFRSAQGASGERTLVLGVSGQSAAGQTAATSTNALSYRANVSGPRISVTSPSQNTLIVRNAQKQDEQQNYVFDVYSKSVQFSIEWPDGYPRSIRSASLLVGSQDGLVKANEIAPTDAGSYRFEWDLKAFATSGDHPVTLQVQVKDELDLEVTSDPVHVTVQTNIPDLGPAVNAEEIEKIVVKETQKNQWLLYVLYGVVGVLLLLLVLMSRKISKLASSGAIGKIVGEVRRTLVGGGVRRGNPLARLKVLEGPQSMIGQELPVYTENVTLGRDPARADFVFFSPDIKTSVSRLHARLERVGGQWRVTALSESGSETFVDDQPIEFQKPHPLQNGQKLRFGYPAHLPVELAFAVEAAAPNGKSKAPRMTEVPSKVRKTDVGSSAEEGGLVFGVKQENGDKPTETVEAPRPSDNPFARYRDRK